MRVKEFLIEQNEERINIIDLSNDLVRAFITLDLTEDKNYMKEKLELAFEIARRSLLKYTENSFSVDGLRVIKKAIVEEIYICDESNTEQKNKRYIFIVASKKLLDKAKEIIENILQY